MHARRYMSVASGCDTWAAGSTVGDVDKKIENVVLVHGAGSGPWVFDGWPDDLSEFSLEAIDLQEDLDVATASMSDYRDRVVAAVEAINGPTALCGWSMGGLVALMAAQEVEPSALVLLEPSPPGECRDSIPRQS